MKELQNLPQGWFHHGRQVLELVKLHQPRECVELGTWRGASAIAIGRTIAPWNGQLMCIDIWDGEVRVEEPRENIRRAGLDNVRCSVSDTVTGAKMWELWRGCGSIDFLYIDADHGYGSVLADLEAWWPHLKPGALIAGDDYGYEGLPGVKQAWDVFEQAHGLKFAHTRSEDPAHTHGMRLVWGIK